MKGLDDMKKTRIKGAKFTIGYETRELYFYTAGGGWKFNLHEIEEGQEKTWTILNADQDKIGELKVHRDDQYMYSFRTFSIEDPETCVYKVSADVDIDSSDYGIEVNLNLEIGVLHHQCGERLPAYVVSCGHRFSRDEIRDGYARLTEMIRKANEDGVDYDPHYLIYKATRIASQKDITREDVQLTLGLIYGYKWEIYRQGERRIIEKISDTAFFRKAHGTHYSRLLVYVGDNIDIYEFRINDLKVISEEIGKYKR